MKINELHELIATVCPIEGINTNGDIVFLPEATDVQKIAAQEIMAAHLHEVVN